MEVVCLLPAKVVCPSFGYVTIWVCGTCQTTQPEPDTPSVVEGQLSDQKVEETHHVVLVLQARDVNVEVRKTITVRAAEVSTLTRTMIRVNSI